MTGGSTIQSVESLPDGTHRITFESDVKPNVAKGAMGAMGIKDVAPVKGEDGIIRLTIPNDNLPLDLQGYHPHATAHAPTPTPEAPKLSHPSMVQVSVSKDATTYALARNNTDQVHRHSAAGEKTVVMQVITPEKGERGLIRLDFGTDARSLAAAESALGDLAKNGTSITSRNGTITIELSEGAGQAGKVNEVLTKLSEQKLITPHAAAEAIPAYKAYHEAVVKGPVVGRPDTARAMKDTAPPPEVSVGKLPPGAKTGGGGVRVAGGTFAGVLVAVGIEAITGQANASELASAAANAALPGLGTGFQDAREGNVGAIMETAGGAASTLSMLGSAASKVAPRLGAAGAIAGGAAGVVSGVIHRDALEVTTSALIAGSAYAGAQAGAALGGFAGPGGAILGGAVGGAVAGLGAAALATLPTDSDRSAARLELLSPAGQQKCAATLDKLPKEVHAGMSEPLAALVNLNNAMEAAQAAADKNPKNPELAAAAKTASNNLVATYQALLERPQIMAQVQAELIGKTPENLLDSPSGMTAQRVLTNPEANLPTDLAVLKQQMINDAGLMQGGNAAAGERLNKNFARFTEALHDPARATEMSALLNPPAPEPAPAIAQQQPAPAATAMAAEKTEAQLGALDSPITPGHRLASAGVGRNA